MDKEKYIIDKYFKPLSKNKESLNLENDAAYLKNKKLIISTDMMIEGQHFKKDFSPVLIARKLLRINLSDVAAMGAEPYGFFLNIAIPKNLTDKWLVDFTKGLKRDMSLFNLKLFGGDLSHAPRIFLSATILGKTKNHCHERNFSKENSDIFISGNLGDATLGFMLKNNLLSLNCSNLEKNYLVEKFMLPQPRLEIGKKLNGHVDFCTDISDGLVRELSIIADQSNLQANIFLNKIPISNVFYNVVNNNKLKKRKVQELILSSGEDYELLFGMSNKKVRLIEKKTKISKIGFFSKGRGLNIFDGKGKKINIKKRGFSHF